MRSIVLYIVSCVVAALVPLGPTWRSKEATPLLAVDWPTHFEGRPLRGLPLSEKEKRFLHSFPGNVARFTDGARELVIRRVTQKTRMLHPASDCFRGSGYSIKPMPIRVGPDGNRWGCFVAAKGAERLLVHETIHDDAGHHWTDVSSWYWSRTSGPWWAITIAESHKETVPPPP